MEAHYTRETGCPRTASIARYTATLAGLSPGRYTLQVVHAYPASAWDPVVTADTTATIR